MKSNKKRRRERSFVPTPRVDVPEFQPMAESEIVRRSSFVLTDLCPENRKGCCDLITPITVYCAYNAKDCCELTATIVMADGRNQGNVTAHVCAKERTRAKPIERHAKRALVELKATFPCDIFRR